MTRLIAGLITIALVGAACSKTPTGTSHDTSGATPTASGIELASIDKDVRPQDDLFVHVNGAWLAKTEIPPDKSSYGAFDMLFDKAQEDLRAIVEDAAKRADKAPGSDAQKIGDFYESFMNDARANQIGLKPLESEMAAIDRLATKTDLARYFARMFKLNVINPLVGYVDGDAKQPDYDTLYVFQGGLGLPDRDYYIKEDPPLRTYREKYLGFLTTILKHANQQAPEATAKQIYALEARLAQAHWTNVESRDAVKTYNKIALADLAKQFPGFDWAAWTGELGIAQAAAIVIGQPSYVKAFAADCQFAAGGRLEAVHPRRGAQWLCAVSQRRDGGRGVRVLRTDTAGSKGKRATVEAGGQDDQRQPRRDAGQVVRRSALQARSQGAHGTPRRQPSPRVQGRYREARVDDAGDQSAGAGEARAVHTEDRIPQQVARLFTRRW